MPTYEYVCEKCNYKFERFQSMKDDPIKICPQCNEIGVRRLVGAGAGIIFKGSGFYETDYKRQSQPGTNGSDKSESSSEKKSENQAENKTDNKSGSKSESKSEKKDKNAGAAA